MTIEPPPRSFTPEEKAKGRRAVVILNIVMAIFIAAPFIVWLGFKRTSPSTGSNSSVEAVLLSLHRACKVEPMQANTIPEGYQTAYLSITAQNGQTVRIPYFVEKEALFTADAVEEVCVSKSENGGWEIAIAPPAQAQNAFTRLVEHLGDKDSLAALRIQGELMGVLPLGRLCTEKGIVLPSNGSAQARQLADQLQGFKDTAGARR